MKKYTRREAIKAGAKVGVAAAVYGTIGGFLGSLYKNTVGYVGNKFYELDKKVEESTSKTMAPVRGAKKVEDYRANFWRRTFGISEKDQAENREAYGVGDSKRNQEIIKSSPENQEISRRSFLKRVLGYSARNPEKAGAVIGATYGATKTIPSAAIDARKNIKLKNLEEKVANLEKKESREREQTLEDYESVYNFMLAGGLSFMLFFSFFSISKITGFSIFDSSMEYDLTGLTFLFIALSLMSLALIIKFISNKKYK